MLRRGGDAMSVLPVVESFGPTVQGEGENAGRRAWFVRLAGCDCDCPWCDTQYAREPGAGTYMSSGEAYYGLKQLPRLLRRRMLVVLTGGNPFIHDCEEFAWAARSITGEVAVETQGTRYQDWAGCVDHITISPKRDCYDPEVIDQLLVAVRQQGGERLDGNGGTAELKVVVVDEDTYEWAVEVHQTWSHLPFTLQALSVNGVPQRLDHWAERFAVDPRWGAQARFLPQLHTIIWGDRRGV